MIGNDGNRMGNTQRFTKFFLGLLFSRSGVKQKETWIFQGQYKKKKDLMQHGKCVLHKVLNSYFFLGSQRMPNFALFRGLEDAEISQKHIMTLYGHYTTPSQLQQLENYIAVYSSVLAWAGQQISPVRVLSITSISSRGILCSQIYQVL